MSWRDRGDSGAVGTNRPGTKGRRQFLKLTAAAGLGTGLAGCSGEQAPATDSPGEPAGTTGTPGSSGPKYAGVNFDFWDVLNVQSNAANQKITRVVNEFESATGARVSLNRSSYQQLAGQKWINAYRNGDYPTMASAQNFWMGRMFEGGWVRPFSEFRSQFDDAVLDDMEWVMPVEEASTRFYDVDIWQPPHAAIPRNAITVRTDLMGQAGYGPGDIPRTGDSVENYNQLMSMAADIQENSDADIGFQIFGDPFDWVDVLSMWVATADAEGSRFFNEDGSAANFDTQLWYDWTKRWVDAYREHEVSGPQSPTISDEATTQLQMGGQCAMSMIEWLNLPTLLANAPDNFTNGNIQYLPLWKGTDDNRGQLGFYHLGINKRHENEDDKRYERRVNAATDLMLRFYTESFQQSYPGEIGAFPIRQSLWESTTIDGQENNKVVETGLQMMEEINVGWPYHEDTPAALALESGPQLQQALRGEISPKEAMDNTDQIVEDLLAK